MTAPRSSLAQFAPLMRDVDEDAAKRIAAKVWHDLGMLIVQPDWVRGWAEQQEVVNIGNKMWGKRNAEK